MLWYSVEKIPIFNVFFSGFSCVEKSVEKDTTLQGEGSWHHVGFHHEHGEAPSSVPNVWQGEEKEVKFTCTSCKKKKDAGMVRSRSQTSRRSSRSSRRSRSWGEKEKNRRSSSPSRSLRDYSEESARKQLSRLGLKSSPSTSCSTPPRSSSNSVVVLDYPLVFPEKEVDQVDSKERPGYLPSKVIKVE